MKKKQTLVKFYKYRSNFFFTQLRCSRSCGISSGTKMRVAAHLWKHVLFFSFSTLLQEGGETCLAETGTFHRWYKWRVFWSYYSVASGSGPISGKRSVSGGVSSSMRRLQLRHGKLRGRRKGGKKKGKGQKGEREREGQLDKNRRESNKEWEINKGKKKKKMLECILLLAREMERNWSLEREMVE